MGRRRGRPAATAIALGVAIGVVLALVVRTIALGDGPRVAESTVNAVALGVAVAALALSFVARRVGRRAPAWLAVAGGTLASLAVAVWLGLGNDVVRFHTWEHFHYYLGAKYFRELSYSRLYACTAVVEAERSGWKRWEAGACATSPLMRSSRWTARWSSRTNVNDASRPSAGARSATT
jgi:hypothetical protein